MNAGLVTRTQSILAILVLFGVLAFTAIETHYATQSVVHSDRAACLRAEDNRLALVLHASTQETANFAEVALFTIAAQTPAAKKLVAPLLAAREAEAAASHSLAVLYAKQLSRDQADELPPDLRRYAHFSCVAAYPDSPIW